MYSEDHVAASYEVLNLRVIHNKRRTGFEETKDFPIRVDELVAGRYQVQTAASSWRLLGVCCPHLSAAQQDDSLSGRTACVVDKGRGRGQHLHRLVTAPLRRSRC